MALWCTVPRSPASTTVSPISTAQAPWTRTTHAKTARICWHAAQFATWKEYEDQLAKYDPEGKVKTPHDGSVSTDWLAVWTFAQEARKLDTVDRDTFREHTQNLTDFQTDVLHDIDFTIQDGPVLTAPRQANLWAFAGHIANGKLNVDDPTPFSAFEKTPVQ